MNLSNAITALESPAGVRDDKSTMVNTPQKVLQSALDALSRGRFSEVCDAL